MGVGVNNNKCLTRQHTRETQRMARSKSLYSRDKMRQHRLRHQRFLRLRKTDYTAGHLLAATTAMRHWNGGSSQDEGFAYSFEEGSRHRHHRHRPGKRGKNRTDRGRVSNSASLSAVSHAGVAARGSSLSPTPAQNKRFLQRDSAGGRGVKSAPRLASLLDADGIYSGDTVLGCPDLEQTPLGTPARFDGDASAAAADYGRSRNLSPNSATSFVGDHGDSRERLRPSTDGGGRGGGSKRGLRRERHSRKRGTKDVAGGGGGAGADGARGASAGADSLFNSHRGGSVSAGEEGLSTHGRDQGGNNGAANGSFPPTRESMVGAELDRIFNPLAFPDEKKGVRVLIQASKPLEVCAAPRGGEAIR